jgi:hypothetical protein
VITPSGVSISLDPLLSSAIVGVTALNAAPDSFGSSSLVRPSYCGDCRIVDAIRRYHSEPGQCNHSVPRSHWMADIYFPSVGEPNCLRVGRFWGAAQYSLPSREKER